MKKLYLYYLTVSFIISSCSSIRVVADYDRSVNFSSFNSFGFFEEGISKVKISDLDKRRILNAIENELISKGLKKSDLDQTIGIHPSSAEEIVTMKSKN